MIAQSHNQIFQVNLLILLQKYFNCSCDVLSVDVVLKNLYITTSMCFD